MIVRQVSVSPERVELQARLGRLVVAAVGCVGLAACGQSTSPSPARQEPAAAGDVVTDAGSVGRLLQACDVAKLRVALQDVLGLPDSAEVLSLLNDVWAGEDSDPAATACIQREVVRIYVANALAQAHANRMIETPQLPSVLEALRAALDSQSSEVVQIAMMGLGDFLTAGDIERLGAIATGPNSANARVAVSALALSCVPGASQELDQVAVGGGVLSQDDVSMISERVHEARRIKCGPSTN